MPTDDWVYDEREKSAATYSEIIDTDHTKQHLIVKPAHNKLYEALTHIGWYRLGKTLSIRPGYGFCLRYIHWKAIAEYSHLEAMTLCELEIMHTNPALPELLKAPYLHLDLRLNPLGDEGVKRLIEPENKVKKPQRLSTLHVGNCGIGWEGLAALITESQLSVLVLDNKPGANFPNSLREGRENDWVMLSKDFTGSQTLLSLGLVGCAASLRDLVLLNSCIALESLDLSANPVIGEEFAEFAAGVLPHQLKELPPADLPPALRALKLASCEIKRLPEVMGQVLAQLRSLDLSGNPLRANHVQGLAHLVNLEILCLNETNLNEAHFQLIFRLMEHHLKELSLIGARYDDFHSESGVLEPSKHSLETLTIGPGQWMPQPLFSQFPVKTLHLIGTRLETGLKDWIVSNSNLETLHLDRCGFGEQLNEAAYHVMSDLLTSHIRCFIFSNMRLTVYVCRAIRDCAQNIELRLQDLTLYREEARLLLENRSIVTPIVVDAEVKLDADCFHDDRYSYRKFIPALCSLANENYARQKATMVETSMAVAQGRRQDDQEENWLSAFTDDQLKLILTLVMLFITKGQRSQDIFMLHCLIFINVPRKHAQVERSLCGASVHWAKHLSMTDLRIPLVPIEEDKGYRRLTEFYRKTQCLLEESPQELFTEKRSTAYFGL